MTNSYKKNLHNEIYLFYFLQHELKPEVYLEVGIDHGKHLTHANINTLCIGIDKDNKIVYPINPYTRIIKGKLQNSIQTKQVEKFLGKKKISMLVINKYRNINNLTAQIQELQNANYINSETLIVVKRLHSIDPNEFKKLAERLSLGRLSYFYDTEYFIISKLEDNLLKAQVKQFRSKHRIVRFGKYWTVKPKKGFLEFVHSILSSRNPRCLGILLCYNDGDILEQNIKHLLQNHHDIVVWDHSSEDETSKILDKYQGKLLERKLISREFDFYHMYQSMSKNIIDNYFGKYDFISWPDQDEILEGPDRKKNYYEHIKNVYKSKYSWIQFNNYVFWMSTNDNKNFQDPIDRLKGYCLYPDCSPRIRAFKMTAINIRYFNHNKPQGKKYPLNFNLRHYPMRTDAQLERRLAHDRVQIARPNMHFHYDYMKHNLKNHYLPQGSLHFDQQGKELNSGLIFDWRVIYGARKLIHSITKN